MVPVPVSPFPDPVGRNVDPFRLPVFIPLNFSNCAADGCELFEGTSNICHDDFVRVITTKQAMGFIIN